MWLLSLIKEPSFWSKWRWLQKETADEHEENNWVPVLILNWFIYSPHLQHNPYAYILAESKLV